MTQGSWSSFVFAWNQTKLSCCNSLKNSPLNSVKWANSEVWTQASLLLNLEAGLSYISFKLADPSVRGPSWTQGKQEMSSCQASASVHIKCLQQSCAAFPLPSLSILYYHITNITSKKLSFWSVLLQFPLSDPLDLWLVQEVISHCFSLIFFSLQWGNNGE